MLRQTEELLLVADRDVVVVVVPADLLLRNLHEQPLLLLLHLLHLLAQAAVDLILELLVSVLLLLQLPLRFHLGLLQPQQHAVPQLHDRHDLALPEHLQVLDVVLQIVGGLQIDEVLRLLLLRDPERVVLREYRVRVLAVQELREGHAHEHALRHVVRIALPVLPLLHQLVHAVYLTKYVLGYRVLRVLERVLRLEKSLVDEFGRLH